MNQKKVIKEAALRSGVSQGVCHKRLKPDAAGVSGWYTQRVLLSPRDYKLGGQFF